MAPSLCDDCMGSQYKIPSLPSSAVKVHKTWPRHLTTENNKNVYLFVNLTLKHLRVAEIKFLFTIFADSN